MKTTSIFFHVHMTTNLEIKTLAGFSENSFTKANGEQRRPQSHPQDLGESWHVSVCRQTERLKILVACWWEPKLIQGKKSFSSNWPESFTNSISERMPFHALCFGKSTITSSDLISSQMRGQPLKIHHFQEQLCVY